MKLQESNELLFLNGKVVQIFEISGEKAIKIFIEPESINLVLGKNEEISLGDTISIEATIPDYTIKSVIP